MGKMELINRNFYKEKSCPHIVLRSAIGLYSKKVDQSNNAALQGRQLQKFTVSVVLSNVYSKLCRFAIKL